MLFQLERSTGTDSRSIVDLYWHAIITWPRRVDASATRDRRQKTLGRGQAAPHSTILTHTLHCDWTTQIFLLLFELLWRGKSPMKFQIVLRFLSRFAFCGPSTHYQRWGRTEYTLQQRVTQFSADFALDDFSGDLPIVRRTAKHTIATPGWSSMLLKFAYWFWCPIKGKKLRLRAHFYWRSTCFDKCGYTFIRMYTKSVDIGCLGESNWRFSLWSVAGTGS